MQEIIQNDPLCFSCICFSSEHESKKDTIYCKYQCFAARPKKIKLKKCSGYKKKSW